MNGGGPRAAPLRALQHVPMVVDDAAVVPRLAAAARSADPSLLDATELVRWTRAWMVACQGALHERGVIGSVPPWTVPLPIGDLPTLKGDPEGRRRAEAISLLDRSGVASLDATAQTLTFDAAAFAEHRAGLEIDWPAVCRVARYEPAALLVTRALAELVVPLFEPTPVTLGDLADRTGYAPKQVRVALRRLVESGILRTTESAGMATQYCFDAVANPTIARRPSPLPQAPTPVPVSQPAPVAPVAPASQRAVALRLTLNGVTVTLGPGLSPHVELGPDGVPHLSLDG